MSTDPTPERCALCIVGAGIAGLNALFVAEQYLGPEDRILLIDRRPGPGGMWNDTYPYVRLHQAHEMFTVGDMPWALDRPRSYLATGAEVLDHLGACLARLRKGARLDERYGITLETIEETDAPRARLTCRTADGAPVVIEADRAIVATGFDVPRLAPLALSSRAVVSTTPELLQDDDTDPAAPVWIVGGGKTGMDTAMELIRRHPGRRISMLTGPGTIFLNRNFLFPEGRARWTKGKLQLAAVPDLVMRYDGRNEDEAFAYFRDAYTVSLDGTGDRFLLGTLSEEENATIAAGLDAVVRDYLEDVVDTDAGPELVLRNGARLAVPAGTVLVNCTGHLLRQPQAERPMLSPRDTVLTITPRSALHFLSSAAAYFGTHLFYRNELRTSGIYDCDIEALVRIDPKAGYLALLTHTFLNTLRMIDTLPFKVFDRCGLDLDRWYPLPRRMLVYAGVRMNSRRYQAHCREVLERTRDRFGIRCGPL